MTVPHSPGPRGAFSRRSVGGAALAAALISVTALAPVPARLTASDPPAAKSKETLVNGQPLFAGWPANQKPDAVIVFSGQTFGYLQPCGCSRPQTGGLERRAVFIEALKAKGWPVAGVDLGDVYPEKVALAKQGKLKYVAAMTAMREMGYLGVGIGKTELQADPLALLAEYALQREQRPFTLAANTEVSGQPAAKALLVPGFKRPLVESIEAAAVGSVPVGVAGVVGGALQDENVKAKWNMNVDFPNAKQAITHAVAALAKHPLKPGLNVLIFQGPSTDAAKVAADFPQFQVILCQTPDGVPAPLAPQTVVGKKGEQTFIVQVGQKGQYVGVLGAFKKAGGGFDLKYQLVPLGEEYIETGTEAEALARNKSLQALETYAKAVKDAKLLSEYPRVPHAAQIQAAGLKPPVNLTYVGSAKCAGCHAAEFKVWKNAPLQILPHSKAMNTLENVAKRPNLRQFDGECVKCHSVGFDHPTGYVDNVKTPHLRDVGCESCHGPGSGHVAAPKNPDFLKYMSPWKQVGAPKLPAAAFMKEMAETPAIDRGKKAVAPAQQVLLNRVEGMCMKCHDNDADPHFDLYKNWPKIDHSGLAPVGGWPVAPPVVPQK
ncbi:cytochrome c family protein [Frigoriglobus tundricola]|uniref:Cytochrome c-552/4 domain-containing protein n=1 Tax=Frigoriglobus tundricola TaxID=2774151 RepID=A0A6M5YFY3_9BACT|nr:cytochrome c family protein [Frigoriglobus tundricola]QJW92878.1 hypothetical protein FTUN_0375 [Frigoriglobus tundricola]